MKNLNIYAPMHKIKQNMYCGGCITVSMWKLWWNLLLLICIAFWFVLIQHNLTFTWNPKFYILYRTTVQVLRFSSQCGWRLHSSGIKSCVTVHCFQHQNFYLSLFNAAIIEWSTRSAVPLAFIDFVSAKNWPHHQW